jgi:hypothetical protein
MGMVSKSIPLHRVLCLTKLSINWNNRVVFFSNGKNLYWLDNEIKPYQKS